MNSPKEANQSVDSSSSKQSLGKLLDVIARELGQLDKLIEGQRNLQAITLVIKFDRRGRPRTVLTRTEGKAELSA